MIAPRRAGAIAHRSKSVSSLAANKDTEWALNIVKRVDIAPA